MGASGRPTVACFSLIRSEDEQAEGTSALKAPSACHSTAYRALEEGATRNICDPPRSVRKIFWL